MRIRLPNVVNVLNSGLRDAPINRLFFRIACRTAEWPWSLKDAFDNLWNKENVGVFELAPLRVQEVEAAANLEGLDAEEFIKAVEEKKAGSLACKPVTLQFLLNLYKKEKSFPEAQADLYEKGCLYLCEDPSLERREKGGVDCRYIGQFNSEQKLAVASRIAACLILSNRFAVYTDIAPSGLPDGCILIPQLTGGQEKVATGNIDIDEPIIGEALKSGLFTSRGRHLMGVAHQTYAEFLAARYLRSAHIDQIKSLLLHPLHKKIVPALYETASWLAGQRCDVFSWLVTSEPELLLRSDVAKADNAAKEKLVSALLDRFKNEDLLDDRGIREYYHKLAHPQISKQLRAFISDKTAGLIPRRVSLEIAEACKVKELQELFAEIALDMQEDYHIRTLAAHNVLDIADKDIKKRLEPLAKGQAGNDPYDDLRAYGMRCMWPDHWGLIELLDNITPPQRENHVGGSYFWFLRNELPASLSKRDYADEIPLAISSVLNWPQKMTTHEEMWREYLYDSIVRMAWALIPDRNIMEKLSELILLRLKKGRPICGESDKNLWSELSSVTTRRREISAFIISTEDVHLDPFRLLCGQTPLIVRDDFPWLQKQIEKALPEK